MRVWTVPSRAVGDGDQGLALRQSLAVRRQSDPATGTALEQKFFALAPKMLPHCGIEVD
jgi:hypothetical protein